MKGCKRWAKYLSKKQIDSRASIVFKIWEIATTNVTSD